MRDQILPQYQALNLRAQVAQVSAFGGGVNNDIQFWIGGPDLAKLDQYAQVLKAELSKVPGTTDVDTNFIVGKPELGVGSTATRRPTSACGCRTSRAPSTSSSAARRRPPTSRRARSTRCTCGPARPTATIAAAIAAMEVAALTRGTVPLRDVVSLQEGTGPSLINRLNRRRQVMVTANMKPGFSQQVAIDTLNKTAVGLKMPASYSFGLEGRSREQGKAAAAFAHRRSCCRSSSCT